MNREPAMILAAVQAAIILLVAFGVNISEEQSDAIIGLGGAVLALITGVAIRSQVTPAKP